MSVPQIEIFSNILTEPLADSFILDSSDFGVLDTDILGGFIEIPFDVPIRSMTISRGKSRQLDRFNAGTCSITFNNFDRRLDPLNTDSDLYGNIIPRQRMNIFADGIQIFSGVVKDWDIEYDQSGWDTASASLADWFTVFANFAFEADVTPTAESPKDRLDFVVGEFNYPGPTDFKGGSTVLGAYQIDAGTGALDYMFKVASSDRASLYVSADGIIELVGVFDKEPTSSVTFADDGSGVPYRSLVNQYGDELLFNRVVASSPAATVSVEDTDSIAQFDVSTLSLTDLLVNSTSGLTSVATSYLVLYSVPSVRFTGLQVELAGLSADDAEVLLRLDLTDQVTVRKSFGVGDPLTVSQNLMVTGVRHTISADSHVIEFSFEPSEFKVAFTLDDVVKGILDQDEYVLG